MHVKLDGTVIPHALRRTAIGCLIQAGVDINEVSNFCCITIEGLQRTHWHHHPDFRAGVRKVRMATERRSPSSPKQKSRQQMEDSGMRKCAHICAIYSPHVRRWAREALIYMVGVAGFEPATPLSRTM